MKRRKYHEKSIDINNSYSCYATGCVDLQLNTGSYGTSVGVGLRSKDGNVRWSQNVDISPRN